jgi:uncharacterized HAD superfamily protein
MKTTMKAVEISIDHIDGTEGASCAATVINDAGTIFDLVVNLDDPSQYDLYDEEGTHDNDDLNNRYDAKFVAAVAAEIKKNLTEN